MQREARGDEAPLLVRNVQRLAVLHTQAYNKREHGADNLCKGKACQNVVGLCSSKVAVQSDTLVERECQRDEVDLATWSCTLIVPHGRLTKVAGKSQALWRRLACGLVE